MKTKNSKKVLALILSFFMILTVLPFNVMAEGADSTQNPPTSGTESGTPGSEGAGDQNGQPAPGTEQKSPVVDALQTKRDEAKNALAVKENEAKGIIEKIKTEAKRTAQEEALKKAFESAGQAIIDATTEDAINSAKETGLTAIGNVEKAAQAIVDAETAEKATQLNFKSYNVYYDAITGKVVDGNNNPVKDALVKVLGRTTYTDRDGNFSFNMTSESGNYYCGYYGYYWKDYPYNSTYIGQTIGSYVAINNYSTGRYFFLVDSNGYVDDVKFLEVGQKYTLNGYSSKTYNVYVSEYGYGYGYGYDNYKYYDKYYNRYYNPNTSWAYNEKLTASKAGYTDATATLYNVTNNSWLYTTCYEYGYPYGYDRVIYPSALSLSGNGTIVSGKVGVSYLPIYVYRNGVFLGSGNADVNGYFSIGLNSRVSSTSDLTFYAYGKGAVAPEKKSEKADHGVIPVKSTVVIGSTKLIKNINGVEADVNMDVAPFIKDGRTMLPLRYIAEALGFKVDWDRATRTVTLTDKEFKVQIPVETNKIIVNGSTYYSDANPVLRNGRTMLPVANIARALGLKDGTDILWDANTRVATITRLVKY